MRAPVPAPVSTAMSRPSALSFLTLSGVAATRVSPSRRSFRTASFIGWVSAVRAEDGEDDHDQPDPGHRVLHEAREALPAFDMLRHIHLALVIFVRICGHECPQRPEQFLSGGVY